jgi:hypothetical protein
MPSKTSDVEYPSLEEEKLALNNVSDAVGSQDWPRVCKEVGGFVEMLAVAAYTEAQSRKPKNLKIAIDFLMDDRWVPRPLGAKMHLARELRNVEAHRLAYLITADDAKVARQIFMDVIAWIHGDKTREQWHEIVDLFESGAKSLKSAPDQLPKATPWDAVLRLYISLEGALNLKLQSLGIPSGSRENLFSRLERIIGAGIDVRSSAWRDVVAIRNTLAHPPPYPSEEDWMRVRSQLGELREILLKLQPKFGQHLNREQTAGDRVFTRNTGSTVV